MRLLAYILIAITAATFGLIYFLRTGDLKKDKAVLNGNKTMVETIKIKTQDEVEIIGDYYEARGDKGILLLHMMPANRKSWVLFAEKLQAKNFKVLAIDLRGHGESTKKITNDKLQITELDYRKFTDEEHQESILDVEAGAEFLKSTLRQSSGQEGKLHLVGVSIGANLALKYLSDHREAKSAVLLSPGLDYRGVKISGLISELKSDQAVFAVASEDDKYSFDSVNSLFEGVLFSDSRMMKIFSARGGSAFGGKDAGHGTAIFEKEPRFMEEVIDWIVGLI